MSRTTEKGLGFLVGSSPWGLFDILCLGIKDHGS